MQLTVPMIAFLVTILLELVIYVLLVLRNQSVKYVSAVTVSLIMFSSTSFLLVEFNVYAVLLLVVSLFRFVNISRVAVARMNYSELTLRFRRSSASLVLISTALVYLLYLNAEITLLPAALYFIFVSSSVLFATTIYSFVRWRSRGIPSGKISTLPTVSVCIPARNETPDLAGCIESVLASTYPKLEILVLDDCSHDKTPAIIKEYAHKGVRFIRGQEPNSSWVAKNSAMNKLFEESKSDIVIFAGVDVRFSSDTVQYVIEQLEEGLLDMISVLPQRSGGNEGTVFIQPLRYWWELAVPRLFGKRPPALSTLWAIKRKKLLAVGGFESVKKSVRPEAHFAKRLSSTYRFVISGDKLGISSVKGMREQFDTALRMRYPQARRRPESVLALLSIEFVAFFGPIWGIFYGLNNSSNQTLLISIYCLVVLIFTNLLISRLTVKKSWLIGTVSLPFLVILEWYVLVRSMIAYEFGIVKWKERNICLPMLQVEKSLPKL